MWRRLSAFTTPLRGTGHPNQRGLASYEAALKANNKVYEAYIYPGLITDSIMIPRPVMTNLPPIFLAKDTEMVR